MHGTKTPSVRDTLQDLIRRVGFHEVSECFRTLDPYGDAPVDRTLRLVRDLENLAPGQGFDLDHQWSAWRSMDGSRFLLKRGNLPELTTPHPSEAIRVWIKKTGTTL